MAMIFSARETQAASNLVPPDSRTAENLSGYDRRSPSLGVPVLKVTDEVF